MPGELANGNLKKSNMQTYILAYSSKVYNLKKEKK